MQTTFHDIILLKSPSSNYLLKLINNILILRYIFSDIHGNNHFDFNNCYK